MEQRGICKENGYNETFHINLIYVHIITPKSTSFAWKLQKMHSVYEYKLFNCLLYDES